MRMNLIDETRKSLTNIIEQLLPTSDSESESLTIKDRLHIILSESIQALALVTTIEDELNIQYHDEDIDLDFFLDFEIMISRTLHYLQKENANV